MRNSRSSWLTIRRDTVSLKVMVVSMNQMEIVLVSQMKSARCDQSVDVALRLGVDAKHSDQQVRGAVNLPHGLGKKVIVIAFAKGDKEKEAQDAGADICGGAELIEKIFYNILEV